LFVGGEFSMEFANKLCSENDEVPKAKEEKHASPEGSLIIRSCIDDILMYYVFTQKVFEAVCSASYF
jgi:hypothetical protein